MEESNRVHQVWTAAGLLCVAMMSLACAATPDGAAPYQDAPPAPPIELYMPQAELVEKLDELSAQGGFFPNIVLHDITAGAVFAWLRARPEDASDLFTRIAQAPPKYHTDLFTAASMALGPERSRIESTRAGHEVAAAVSSIELFGNDGAGPYRADAPYSYQRVLFRLGVLSASRDDAIARLLFDDLAAAPPEEHDMLIQVMASWRKHDHWFEEFCERHANELPGAQAVIDR